MGFARHNGLGFAGLGSSTFGLPDLSAAASAGQGALGMAVGRARAVSGLPITVEEAARSIYDAVNGPGAAAAVGLVHSINGAGATFADALRQAADDVGSNLSDVSRGFDVLRSAYTREGNDIAARAAALLGGSTAATAASYSLVYVGTLLYQQGVFDGLISTVKSAVLDSDTFAQIGSALGLSGTASPAAGAFISAAVGTLTSMWEAWKEGTTIKIGSEPPATYWGKVTAAIYGWDGTRCGPSWNAVKDRIDPSFDPILREWQVITDYTGSPRRLIDLYGREKLRGEAYRRWINRDRGAGCPNVGATCDDGQARYNPLGEGGMYNPSAWPPNDATRMRGVKAPYYCAHAAKVTIWCDGTSRNNNVCRSAFQYGPGSGGHDQSYMLRGGLVAACYLGANVSGIQNLGGWDSPNCGWGGGTWISGRFWDLGIGGSEVGRAKRSNWLACVLVNGQVLLRPPVEVSRLLAFDGSTGDTTSRVAFLNKGIWYPMYPWTDEDASEFRAAIDGWRPLYADVATAGGPIPTTVENGIAQASPTVPSTVRLMARPKTSMARAQKSSSVAPVAAGAGVLALLAWLALS